MVVKRRFANKPGYYVQDDSGFAGSVATGGMRPPPHRPAWQRVKVPDNPNLSDIQQFCATVHAQDAEMKDVDAQRIRNAVAHLAPHEVDRLLTEPQPGTKTLNPVLHAYIAQYAPLTPAHLGYFLYPDKKNPLTATEAARKLVSNTHVSGDDLMKAGGRTHQSWEVRQKVAQDCTHPAVLSKLLHDNDVEVSRQAFYTWLDVGTEGEEERRKLAAQYLLHLEKWRYDPDRTQWGAPISTVNTTIQFEAEVVDLHSQGLMPAPKGATMGGKPELP